MTLQEIADKYGYIDDNGQPLPAAKARWIEEHLTDEDIEAWHNGDLTDHTRQLMGRMEVEAIEVWGSNDGPEPLSVNLV